MPTTLSPTYDRVVIYTPNNIVKKTFWLHWFDRYLTMEEWHGFFVEVNKIIQGVTDLKKIHIINKLTENTSKDQNGVVTGNEAYLFEQVFNYLIDSLNIFKIVRVMM